MSVWHPDEASSEWWSADDVASRPTQELVSVLLAGTNLGSGAIDSVAEAVENGEFAHALATANLASAAGLAGAAERRLLAAREVLRRATLAPRPRTLHGLEDIAAIAQRELGALTRERVLVIVCDAENRPIRAVVVAEGAVDRCLFPVREILGAALRLDGRAFAVAHNHPTGDVEPSESDKVATARIRSGAWAADLRFLGHVLVTGHGRWSAVTREPQTPG